MIRILHIVSSLDSGGVEKMLYNYHTHLEKGKYIFDFIVHGQSIGRLEEYFIKQGSKIFHVTPKKESIWKNFLEVNKIIRDGEYEIIHCHQNFSNFSSLIISKLHKIPIRISHSHGFSLNKTIKRKFVNKILRTINNEFANYYFACGEDAGKWLHGKNWGNGRNDYLMKNAIDLNQFNYNSSTRKIIREKMNIDDKIVLLHVGRFSGEKNHEFLLDVLAELPSNYVLLLVGNGPLFQEIRSQVIQKSLLPRVKFLGVRNDVSELMNASDVFLFPSISEGLGMVAVEAQATGLPVIASNYVPKQTNLSNIIYYEKITSAISWANRITNLSLENREAKITLVKANGYSIENESFNYHKWIQNVFSLKGE